LESQNESQGFQSNSIRSFAYQGDMVAQMKKNTKIRTTKDKAEALIWAIDLVRELGPDLHVNPISKRECKYTKEKIRRVAGI
jgi:hypothetical protein